LFTKKPTDKAKPITNRNNGPTKSKRHEANNSEGNLTPDKKTKPNTNFEGKEMPKNEEYPKQKDPYLSMKNKDKDRESLPHSQSESLSIESPKDIHHLDNKSQPISSQKPRKNDGTKTKSNKINTADSDQVCKIPGHRNLPVIFIYA